MTKDNRARLPGFDLCGPSFLADPYEMVARAHREAPVFYNDATESWFITKYQDISHVFQDWETFSSRSIGRIPPLPICGSGHRISQRTRLSLLSIRRSTHLRAKPFSAAF